MNKNLDQYENLAIRACKKSLDHAELLRRLRKIWVIRTAYTVAGKKTDWFIASFLFEILEKRKSGGIKASDLAFQLHPENEWRIINPGEQFTYEEKAILIASSEIACTMPTKEWEGFILSCYWRNKQNFRK